MAVANDQNITAACRYNVCVVIYTKYNMYSVQSVIKRYNPCRSYSVMQSWTDLHLSGKYIEVVYAR